jgi:hypothetical protein
MTITQSSTRFVAVVGGAVVALGLMFGAIATPAHAAALTSSQVSAIISLLQSFGADANTIANVQASLNGQATTGTTGGTTTGGSCATTFTRSLTIGSTGADVMALQKFLNMSASTMVASSGAGSPGMETSTFGPATKAAVMKFQTANGISPVSGYFGPLTMAKANSLCGSVTVTPTPTPNPTGTGTATVSAAAQPANGIAPNNAARVPFTKFTVTASGGNVTLNNVTVQRDGIASDQAFSGVMLLDQNGNQVGITKTLNSNHQAVVGSAVVIPNGSSMTFTVAANRGNTSTYAGQIATFSVVAVNTSAAVTNGALPISGASQTINEASNLIGSITAQKGTNDPGSANTENVGQTNYIFSSIRLTAGSNEDVYVKSVRWHQIGSVSQSYLANVVSVIDGTSYPTTVTADNYYTTTFPGQGILIQKGFSKDVAIQGDITNGSATTVEFDVQKSSDINVVGAQYGYGILPSFSNGSGSAGTVNSTDDPYYTGYQVTVTGGVVTVSTSNAVTSSNVALNQQDQILGGFSVQDQGEPVTVGRMVFNFSFSGSATYSALTNVKLVDQNGTVLAGPTDATTGGTDADAKVTFTDTVTVPVGTTQLMLKGKLGTAFSTNDTVQASTSPTSGWTTVTGQTTGRSITISPAGPLTSASQTVKAASLSVTVASTPIAQTVIAGSNQFTFSNIILDATASGEDLRLTTLPVRYRLGTPGTANDLTNCQVYNGSTSVSDQHVYNPTSSVLDNAAVSFSLNSGGIVIPKGTTVTLSVKCDIRSGATGTYSFGLNSSDAVGSSGVSSGSSVNGTLTTSSGNTMTASSGGSLAVAKDSSSPSYGVVSAGSTGVDLGHIRFSATNEDLDLRQVALQLESTGSRTDLVNNTVTLWDATTNTQIGTAVFPSGSNATSSQIASGAFRIPANGSRIMIVKGDIAGISVSGPLTVSGDILKVNYDGNNVSGTNGTYAVGVASGQNRQPSDADTSVAGVEIYKSFPTFTYSTAGGVAVSGNQTLLTLTVSADAKGDVTLNKLTFDVNPSSAFVTSLTFSGPNGSVASTSLATTSGGTTLSVYFDNSSNTSDAVVPAGTTKTYNLRGTVTLTGNTGQNGSVSTKLKADTSSISMGATSTAAVLSSNMIWSPESTTTAVVGTGKMNDWTNGYGLGGCFTTSGLGQDCFANVISK